MLKHGSSSMEENQHDLTYNLPHEILQLILSLLTMKEAVRTCLLSTAWSSLWEPLTVNLEADGFDDGTMKQIIATFIDNHEATRKLKISVGQQIIVVATKGYDNELHLDFHKDEKFITATGNHSSIFKLEPPSSPSKMGKMTGFLSLKTLHLRSVGGCFAEDFASALLSSCCFLKSLKFEKCGGLKRVDIVASGGTSLEILEFSDCPNVDSMVVSAPNLKSLHYTGVLPATIQLEGTPLLVDVKFDVGYGVGQNEFDCEQILLFLASLKDTEFLTISGWIIEWMCSAGVIFGRLDFKLSKLKKLWCIHSGMDARKRDSLACFLNIAPVLEMLFINLDENCKSMPPPFFNRHWHEPHLWMDYTRVKSEASHQRNLKVVNITGFSLMSRHEDDDDDDELLLLMDLLLHKALNLKAMTITSLENNNSWNVTKMPSSQIPKWQKNNPKSKVVSNFNEQSLFVLTEIMSS